jgi:predicted phosphodiesterase
MSRRHLLQGVIGGAASAPLLCIAETAPREGRPTAAVRGGFSQDDIRVRLYSPAAARPVKLLFLADTHLFRDDERGAPFREFSGRMAKGYNHTRHFRSKEMTNPEACFEATLRAAKEAHMDAVVLGGDIVSFPSEAAIEWVLAQLKKAGLPWIYTAGNHDWHYEGTEGSSAELRAAWTEKRLLPFHQGRHPLMSVLEVAGVQVVVMDNSTYEIQPEQLEFFRRQVASGRPMVLCIHIPLYAPGRPVGFGCGHPGWGAEADRNFAIERRPQWRAEGHTQVTLDFHREVFSAPNLLGVFAGHTHQASLDVLNGIPQVVTGANATGAHLILEVLPVTSA